MRAVPDSFGRTLSATFKFRLSEAERHTLNANAAALGVTPSAYLRLASTIPARAIGVEEAAVGKSGGGRAGSLPRPPIVVYDRASIPRLHMQLRRWGHHLNQATHALNVIAAKEFMRPEDAERAIGDAAEAIRETADARAAIEARIEELEETWAAKLSAKGVV